MPLGARLKGSWVAMATTIAHKVYYWVETSIENEYKPWKPKEVAHKHGVPAKELFTYWQKEIDCDRATWRAFGLFFWMA